MAEPGETRPTAEEPATAEAAAEPDGADAADTYGAEKARTLLRMFREDTGRDARTAGELSEWIVQRNR